MYGSGGGCMHGGFDVYMLFFLSINSSVGDYTLLKLSSFKFMQMNICYKWIFLFTNLYNSLSHIS